MAKSQNFDTFIVRFTMGSAGAEAVITHTLGRVPVDGIIVDQQGGGNLFRSATPWTSSQVSFESGVGGSFYAIMLI